MIIYKVTNLVNGKVYIGQTKHSLDVRKQRHLQQARKGTNTHFYQAIRKYGEDMFIWEIICSAKDKQTLNELETFFINKFDSIKHGYNMVDGGDNNIMDIESVKTHHDEVMKSPEVRNKISTTMKKLRAEKGFSNETRQKISLSLKGRKYTEERRKKCATRSLKVYCIYNGKRYDFSSIKDAGVWWNNILKPFPYSVCIYQRKIQQNIKLGYCTYGRCNGDSSNIIDNIKWYYLEETRLGGDKNANEVTNTK